MGLTIDCKGLTDEGTYDCGYIKFTNFRIELAKTYNAEFGELYEKWLFNKIDESEFDRMNELCNDDLDILLSHSDCDGEITHQEAKKIYEVIKDLQMDMEGHNYSIMKSYNMLEQWKEIFVHSYQNKVNIYFS